MGAQERGHRAVVGEHEPRGQRRRRLEGVEEPDEIRTQRGVAQHHRDALARAVEHFLGGDRLVVRGEAGRGDRRDLLAGRSGCVSLDAGAVGEAETAQELGVAAPGVGPPRHLAHRQGARVGQRLRERLHPEPSPLVRRPALRVRADHPVEAERRREQRVGDHLECRETAELPELQGIRDDRRGAERQHETRERGRRRQGGRVHVGIDVARNQDAARRVDDPRARADHLVAHADVRDPFAARGDVGRVELPGVHVEQGSAAHIEIGGGGAASDVGEAPTLSDGHSDQL